LEVLVNVKGVIGPVSNDSKKVYSDPKGSFVFQCVVTEDAHIENEEVEKNPSNHPSPVPVLNVD